MKYIVCRVRKHRKIFLDIPVVFPDLLVHAVMFEHVRNALLAQWPSRQGYSIRPLSAGSIASIENFGECHGESESLGVKSRGKLDTELVRMADYGSCMRF